MEKAALIYCKTQRNEDLSDDKNAKIFLLVLAVKQLCLFQPHWIYFDLIEIELWPTN